MQPAIAAAVVMLILFAGAFAAIFGRGARAEVGESRPAPRWQVAALCSAAVALAVLVLAFYL